MKFIAQRSLDRSVVRALNGDSFEPV